MTIQIGGDTLKGARAIEHDRGHPCRVGQRTEQQRIALDPFIVYEMYALHGGTIAPPVRKGKAGKTVSETSGLPQSGYLPEHRLIDLPDGPSTDTPPAMLPAANISVVGFSGTRRRLLRGAASIGP